MRFENISILLKKISSLDIPVTFFLKTTIIFEHNFDENLNGYDNIISR